MARWQNRVMRSLLKTDIGKRNRGWPSVHSDTGDHKARSIRSRCSDPAGWQNRNRDADDVIFHHPAVTIISWGIFVTTVLISDCLFMVIFFDL